MSTKSEIRRKKLTAIAELCEEYINESDRIIAEKLFDLPQYKNAKTVFAYYSVGREVSTREIIKKALADGKKLALPVCEGNGIMHFELCSDISSLHSGAYGIKEPHDMQTVCPGKDDIVLVPAVCVDRNNARLGHGMGYYDRYLSQYACMSVCLARELLIEEKLPTEAHDIAVDTVITEK